MAGHSASPAMSRECRSRSRLSIAFEDESVRAQTAPFAVWLSRAACLRDSRTSTAPGANPVCLGLETPTFISSFGLKDGGEFVVLCAVRGRDVER